MIKQFVSSSNSALLKNKETNLSLIFKLELWVVCTSLAWKLNIYIYETGTAFYLYCIYILSCLFTAIVINHCCFRVDLLICLDHIFLFSLIDTAIGWPSWGRSGVETDRYFEFDSDSNSARGCLRMGSQAKYSNYRFLSINHKNISLKSLVTVLGWDEVKGVVMIPLKYIGWMIGKEHLFWMKVLRLFMLLKLLWFWFCCLRKFYDQCLMLKLRCLGKMWQFVKHL